MNLEDIETILDQLEYFLRSRDGKPLPNGQRAVLHGLLLQPDWKYEQLAIELRKLGLGSYTPKTLKNDAHNLFRRLTTAFESEIRINKTNVQRVVLAWDKTQRRTSRSLVNLVPELQTTGNLLPLDCWQDDLEHLNQRVKDGRRVVCISGSPHIGKTYFTRALCDRLKSEFKAPPIWCTASHVPTLESLYRFVMEHLGEVVTEVAAIPALIELFCARQLVLVIDGTELLYKPQQLAGRFKDSAAGYETWLRQVVEVPVHHSCLLWVGREPPACFEYSRGSLILHQVKKLQDRDALNILNAQNMTLESVDERRKLLDFCGGNPDWLLMAVTRVKQLYKGSVADFLVRPLLAEEVIDTLSQTLERLSDLERLLLVWFLLRPLSSKQLPHFHNLGASLDDQATALFSLQRRGLVQQDERYECYRIDPPLLRYGLAKWIVMNADVELSRGTLNYLCQYPLLYTSAPLSLQNWQMDHLLKAIARRLDQQHAFQDEQLAVLQRCLLAVQQLPSPQQGYAAGNLLNLAVILHLPIARLDFNGLKLCHADLRQINWQRATLSNCIFQETLLPTNLTDQLTGAISPDGSLIAVGDQDGHLLCWQREQDNIQLCAVRTLPSGISTILCPDNDTLLFIANQAVYTWWIQGESHPRKLIDLLEPASCLAQSSLGDVAVGLITGQIILRDGSSHSPKTLNAHESDIYNLSFSHDRQRLASLDRDNRVLEWNLDTYGDDPPTWREIPTKSAVCLAVKWDDDRLLRAEVNPYRIRLWIGETDFHDQAIADKLVRTLHFSADGQYLVGCTDSDCVIHWAWRSPHSFTSVPLGAAARGCLTTTIDGQWLLITSPKQIQLFDIQKQERVWQADVAPGNWSGTTFKNVSGLSAAEIDLLHSLGVSSDP